MTKSNEIKAQKTDKRLGTRSAFFAGEGWGGAVAKKLSKKSIKGRQGTMKKIGF